MLLSMERVNKFSSRAITCDTEFVEDFMLQTAHASVNNFIYGDDWDIHDYPHQNLVVFKYCRSLLPICQFISDNFHFINGLKSNM